ncbi:D-2-hydroxyacid dehydrogenase [Halalkalibacterium halodurans]|uniref:3-phosphoglycerate dehydrogenase n=1 Tax=Halalkalibacterium halodurans TaxID=86665 RepID=A0A0M0KC61_ALKHA|nr:D-2-hydroxyacid dehydrogenase [Halalkalibacterium halodurans]MED3648387.1 D-2-hydroxyacid dehydrogenase [Halalkalibacterium halodurans]TES52493.1 D-2-hydroxyacid dehydrogenase [Halalkalibacterium halodurans]TPE70392.1 D-2-hydroxyacid dehydrogenase [Halalkalibacterium halodurans]
MNVVSSARVRPEIQQELLDDYPNVHFHFFERMEIVGSALEEADVLITYGEDVTEEHLQAAKKLKWIMVISAGVEQLPFQAIKEKGIIVTNAKGIHAIPMAEYTLSMMLQVARNAKRLISLEQEQTWDRRVPMIELNGQTVGVLGAGAIGQEIARLAKAFRMKTIGMNSTGRTVSSFDQIVPPASVDTLLKNSDFVVSVLPFTKKTEGFMTYERFQLMKPSAVFINIGRGKTVKQTELLKALEEKAISHAVLDVFEEEPLEENHPFWTMDSVTVTPHLSGISRQYQPRAFAIFRENFDSFLAGNPPLINRINLDEGY